MFAFEIEKKSHNFVDKRPMPRAAWAEILNETNLFFLQKNRGKCVTIVRDSKIAINKMREPDVWSYFIVHKKNYVYALNSRVTLCIWQINEKKWLISVFHFILWLFCCKFNREVFYWLYKKYEKFRVSNFMIGRIYARKKHKHKWKREQAIFFEANEYVNSQLKLSLTQQHQNLLTSKHKIHIKFSIFNFY